MNLKLGLFIAVLIGIAVALFPLYSDSLQDKLWSVSATTGDEDEGGTTMTIEGQVSSVDPVGGYLTVDGTSIKVRGTWVDQAGNQTLESYELLELIQPGYHVSVVATEKGRWGPVADEITVQELGLTFIHED